MYSHTHKQSRTNIYPPSDQSDIDTELTDLGKWRELLTEKQKQKLKRKEHKALQKYKQILIERERAEKKAAKIAAKNLYKQRLADAANAAEAAEPIREEGENKSGENT